MNSWLILGWIATALPLTATAAVTPLSCLDINRAVGVAMTEAMIRDLQIDQRQLVLNQTHLTLLDVQPVTAEMALYYAHQDIKELDVDSQKLSGYQEIYTFPGTQNLIVNYDYQNKAGKHNKFIASMLINDEECSVRFNGYIIVKREF